LADHFADGSRRLARTAIDLAEEIPLGGSGGVEHRDQVALQWGEAGVHVKADGTQ